MLGVISAVIIGAILILAMGISSVMADRRSKMNAAMRRKTTRTDQATASGRTIRFTDHAMGKKDSKSNEFSVQNVAARGDGNIAEENGEQFAASRGHSR